MLDLVIATLRYFLAEALIDALNPHYDPARDLDVLGAMAAELRDYLVREPLYWRMRAPGNYPMLTLGGYLLRLHRVSALGAQLASAQRDALAAAQAEYQAATGEWAVHAGRKVVAEVKARAQLLSQYAGELQAGSAARGHWAHEAETRTMLHHLLGAARSFAPAERNALAERVTAVDGALQRHLERTRFIGDPLLEPAYPPDEYWWLYRRPRGTGGDEGE
jgi:hypothetical protein